VLQHVSLEVPRSRADECAAFWALLGFARVEPPGELGDRSTWVEREGTQIHLLWADDAVVPPQGHAAVVVEDFAVAWDALHAAGFEPEERPAHWGARRAFVRDPVGHRVELMAAPPPPTPTA
jgi:catechol 2,3-dioxygenase-like lactoylglutathione lyase family enzyme